MKRTIFNLFFLAITTFSVVGCLNVPLEPNLKIIESNEISYDNGEKNSGIILGAEDKKGFIVTPNFVKRYNSLIDKYAEYINLSGEKIIYKNTGIIKLCEWMYYIDNQHMSYFLYLNTIHKQNIYFNNKK